MIVVLESALVLAFPAFALWAARTGGTGRLWRVTAVALALIGGLALMAASAGFGNRLAAQQGYGRTALGTLALAALVGGLPILAGAVTLHAAAPAPQRMGPLRPRRGCRLVARLLGRIAALYVLRALP